jgi:hypothetical protein
MPREERNILRLMFGNPRVRAAQEDWESVARVVVGAFRADAARAGATAEISELVKELSHTSPEFDRLWRDNDVVAHGEGLKRINHLELGLLELEFSAFAVDGRPELGMVVYNPATAEVADRIRHHLREHPEGGHCHVNLNRNDFRQFISTPGLIDASFGSISTCSGKLNC